MTGFLLSAELVRLTNPVEFFWFQFSPLWLDGPSSLGLLLAGMAALLVAWPAVAALMARTAPPIGLALAMLANLVWFESLAWWAIIAAGWAWWSAWLLQIRLSRLGIPVLVGLAVLDYLVLLFLFVDTRFFVATNSHLGLIQIWVLRFSGILTAAGLSPATQANLAATAAGYLLSTLTLGFLLRDRLPPPPAWRLRLCLGLGLLAIHILQFDFLSSQVPLPSYLTFRLQFGTHLFPQARRLSGPDFAPPAGPLVNPADCYRPGRFAWNSPARPNLVICLVESWRADMFQAFMPRLRNRTGTGLWFRQHYAQANSTPATVAGLYSGCYPLNFLLQFPSLEPPAFFRFLREAGYHLHFVPGAPVPWTQEIAVFHEGFEEHPPDLSSATIPQMTLGALDKAANLLSRPGPHLIEIYLYNTHFDYRYPPEFERYSPVLPENTDVLSLTPNTEDITGITNRYRNSLLFLDDALDAFLTRVTADPMASNTLLVVIGDHGESFGEAGFFAHATGPIIDQFHVPFLIFGPGIRPEVIDRLSQHVDLLPTLGPLLGFTLEGLAGEDARTASRPAVLNFDFSADNRVIVRSRDRMSLFDFDTRGHPSWVLTMRNEFTLDRFLYDAYTASTPSVLPALVREDFQNLARLLDRVPHSAR